MRYNEKIAAQVAAYFIHREGGSIKILKLMKLMYLTERESLRLYSAPMIGDLLVSMQHGPVLSITYDHMSDSIASIKGGWNDWISDKENHCVSLVVDEDPINKLLELSDADLGIMNDVYGEFGHLDAFELRDLTHEICGEWEDPHFSSNPIPYDRLLKNVNYSPEIAAVISQDIDDKKRLDNLLNEIA